MRLAEARKWVDSYATDVLPNLKKAVATAWRGWPGCAA